MMNRTQPVGTPLRGFAAALGCLVLFAGACSSPSGTMSWMTGSWSGSAWGGTLNADYMSTGDMVVGYSELIREGEVAHYEFEVFRNGDAPSVTPFPKGKMSATFGLIERGHDFVLYENTEKDFPTRLWYGLADERLVVVLSDPVNAPGKEQRFEFERVE
ncbi:MAG: DUF6265 family protein [Planctomycetota bacterium]